MQSDDAEDGAGQQGGYGDEQEPGVGAEGGEGVDRDLAKLLVAAPGVQRCGCADEHGCERKCDQEDVETDVRAGGEPVNQMARGLRGFVGSGLNVAEKEREHEKSGGEDEEEFDGGDEAFEKHACFILQSTMRCQVAFRERAEQDRATCSV